MFTSEEAGVDSQQFLSHHYPTRYHVIPNMAGNQWGQSRDRGRERLGSIQCMRHRRPDHLGSATFADNSLCDAACGAQKCVTHATRRIGVPSSLFSANPIGGYSSYKTDGDLHHFAKLQVLLLAN